MLRIIILFRTADGVKCCLFYSKQWSVVLLDFGYNENAQYFFQIVHNFPDFWKLENGSTSLESFVESNDLPQRFRRFVSPRLVRGPAQEARPHRRVDDVVLLKDVMLEPTAEGGKESFKEKLKKEMKQEKTVVKNLFDLNLEDASKKHEEEDKIEDEHLLLECPKCKTPAPPCLRGGSCQVWRLLFLSRLKCTMLVNGHLAACMIKSIGTSKRFRRRLFKNLLTLGGFCVPHGMPKHMADRWYERFCDFMNVDWMIDIVSVWPEQRIDYKWGWYLNHILTKRLLLDEAMAWLSTLGGAHSSLGEYYTHHAEMAGHISKKQLKLALTVGDPLTVGRCYMFWAFSLLQRHGCNRVAKTITRRVHHLARNHSVEDSRLINICLAAWKRLQFLHKRCLAQKTITAGSVKSEEAKSDGRMLNCGDSAATHPSLSPSNVQGQALRDLGGRGQSAEGRGHGLANQGRLGRSHTSRSDQPGSVRHY